MRFTLLPLCTAAVLKCYSLVVQSPPPWGNRRFLTAPPPHELSRHWGGDYTVFVSVCFWILDMEGEGSFALGTDWYGVLNEN